MKEKSIMKKVNSTLKTKMIAIAMAALTTASAGAMTATPVFAAEYSSDVIPAMEQLVMEEHEEDFEEIVLPTVHTVDGDESKSFDKMMDEFMQKSVESLFELGKSKLGEKLPDLSEKIFDVIPVANYLNKVGVGQKVGSLIANALGIAPDDTQPSMKEISKQIREISNDIEKAKTAINDHADDNLARELKAIENIQAVNDYKVGMQQLANAFDDAQTKLQEVQNAPEQDQLVQMASLCGSSKYWTVEGTLLCSLTKVGSFISGNKNFISDKNFYEALYQLAVDHGAVFSGQAKTEVETYVTNTLETYMATYAIAVASLDAQQTLREIKDSDHYEEFLASLSPTMKQTCKDIVSNQYDITSKKKVLGRLLIDADGNGNTLTVLGQYQNFIDKSNGIFITRSGQLTKEYKDIVLSSAAITCENVAIETTSNAPYVNLKASNDLTMNDEKLAILIKYAKDREITIAQALKDAQFDIPANTKYILAGTKVYSQECNFGGTYETAYCDIIFSVEAYDIYSTGYDKVRVPIRSIQSVINGNRRHFNTNYVRTVNFLCFNEKTDGSSVFGKVTDGGYSMSTGTYTMDADMTITSAVRIPSGADVTIDLNGHKLVRNDTSADGGPVFIAAAGAKLTVIDSSNGNGSITGYNASKGGAVSVSVNASCTLKGIRIVNSASLEGGAIRNEGKLTVIDCVFSNIGSTNKGGVIANFGTAKVTGTKFTGCKAGNAGGVIYNAGSFEAENCEFTKNQALDGGVIFNYTSGTVTLNNVVISENKTTQYGGGAVTNYGTLTVKNFNINNNTAASNGGAIWTNNYAYLENGSMESNTANADGGAVTVADGLLELHEAVLSSNTAKGHGGAIRNKADKGTVKAYNTIFEYNSANGDGGAASIRGINEFHNCVFSDNKSGNKGGALDLASSSNTKLYGCSIYDNTAPKGSAVRYDNSAKYYLYDGTYIEGSIY